MQELEKKVLLMQGLLDSYGLRINQCEINSKQAWEKVNDKPEKRDIFDVKEDLRIFKMNMQSYLSQCVDLEKWQKGMDQLSLLNRIIMEYGRKADLDRYIDEKLKQNNSDMIQKNQSEFNQNVKQIQMAIKKVQNDYERLKITIGVQFDSQQNNINELRKLILSNISMEQLEFYLQEKVFTKKELDNLDNRFEELNSQFQTYITKIDSLTAIVNKFDYQMLFRASKMEFETLSKALKDNEQNIIEMVIQMVDNENRNNQLKIKNDFDKLNQQCMDLTREFLSKESRELARREFIEYFKGVDIQKLKQQLLYLEQTLDTKISKEEFSRFEQQKQSKYSAEIFAKYMQTLQYQMKNLIRSNLQFFKLFDVHAQQQSINLRKGQYHQVIESFEGSLLQLEQLNLSNNNRIQQSRLKTQVGSPRTIHYEEGSNRGKASSIDSYPVRCSTSLKYPTNLIPSVKLRPLLDNLSR